MAVQVTTKLVCDACLAWKQENAEGTTTRQFGADGNRYEVDVCDLHAKEIDNDLTRWARIGRKAGTKAKAIGAAKAQRPSQRQRDYDLGELRAWATIKGVELPTRGRIPAHIIEEFKADVTKPKAKVGAK